MERNGITKSSPKARPDKGQASHPIAASQDSINGARFSCGDLTWWFPSSVFPLNVSSRS